MDESLDESMNYCFFIWWIIEWMDESLNEWWIIEWMDDWMNRWMNYSSHDRINHWVNIWIIAWMDKWLNEPMIRWMDE